MANLKMQMYLLYQILETKMSTFGKFWILKILQELVLEKECLGLNHCTTKAPSAASYSSSPSSIIIVQTKGKQTTATTKAMI